MANKGIGVPPYGTAIQEAIATGDVAKMKQVATVAEHHLAQVGDVRSALEHLKIEIAKLEHKRKK